MGTNFEEGRSEVSLVAVVLARRRIGCERGIMLTVVVKGASARSWPVLEVIRGEVFQFARM